MIEDRIVGVRNRWEVAAVSADDASYVEFVTARWSALYRTAYLLTGSAVGAEDALQSTLLKTFAAWSRVRRLDAPEAYVRRTLVNHVVSEGRRRRTRSEVPHGDLPEPAPHVRPTREVDDMLDRADLWPRICALPPRQRAVVVLRYYEDLSEQQIAAALGCAVGTVKSQASDALRSLRAGLVATTETKGDS